MAKWRSAKAASWTIAFCFAWAAIEAQADVITEWNEVLLRTVAAESNPPPVAARNLAMLHAAMYDAVNSIDRTHRPYLVMATADGIAAQSQGLLETAAAQAAYDILVSLYPKRRTTFDATLAASFKTYDPARRRAGVDVGRRVARDVIRWRSDDGSNRVADHMPSYVRGKCAPTPSKFAPAMLPGWADLKPFAIEQQSQFRQQPPPALESAEYAAAFEEVKALGGAKSGERTKDQTQIALFWADGIGTATPPGHWNRIAQAIVKERGSSVTDNARLFALLNIALADAAIVCWDMKYHYNCWRPVTAIRHADADGNPDTMRDPQWLPLLETPPFPSCPSGHSTFSAAAATVLILHYRTDEISFSSVGEATKLTRSYKTISDAAREAGVSRVYGGIHFDFDNLSGLTAGEALGRYVVERFCLPLPKQKAGPAAPTAPKQKPKKAASGSSGGAKATDAPAPAIDPGAAPLWPTESVDPGSGPMWPIESLDPGQAPLWPTQSAVPCDDPTLWRAGRTSTNADAAY